MSFRRAHTSARVAFVNDLPLGAAPFPLGALLAGRNAGFTRAQVHKTRVRVFFSEGFFGIHASNRAPHPRCTQWHHPQRLRNADAGFFIITGAPMTQEPKRPVANTRGAA